MTAGGLRGGLVLRGVLVLRGAPIPALALLLLASGCSNQPCNPHTDRNLFQAGACVLGSGYQDRVNQLQGELTEAERERDAAAAGYRAALARQDDAAAEGARLERDLAEQRRRSIALERDIAAARDRTRLDRQRLAGIEAELGALRGEQSRLRSAPGGATATQAEMERLRLRQEALERQWQLLRRAAPVD